jgi:tRNA modification GTPase
MENEFIAIDIRKAIKKIGELTGEIYNEDILNSIFSNFCIGK